MVISLLLMGYVYGKEFFFMYVRFVIFVESCFEVNEFLLYRLIIDSLYWIFGYFLG